MTPEQISWNGRIITPGELEIPLAQFLATHFVYQRIHTLAGKGVHLDRHLDLASRTLRHIYRLHEEFDQKTIAAYIAETLKANRYPAQGSATVLLCFFPGENRADLLIMCERPLLDKGYAVSSLRPKAVSHEYDMPYSAFPTGFQLSAARMHDALAMEQGATRSVRCRGDLLLSCGDSPLFGIKRKTLFTAPLTGGAVDSVERQLVISAANRAKMDFLEEAIPHSELKDFDELFYADAAGITSLSECDGAKLMSLLVGRLICKF